MKIRDADYKYSWMISSICGPKGISEAIVKKTEKIFTQAMKEPAGMRELCFPIFYRNIQEMGDYVTHNYMGYRVCYYRSFITGRKPNQKEMIWHKKC